MSFKKQKEINECLESLEAKGNKIVTLDCWFKCRFTHEMLEVPIEEEIEACTIIKETFVEGLENWVGKVDQQISAIEHFSDAKQRERDNNTKFTGDSCKRHVHIHGKFSSLKADVIKAWIDHGHTIGTKKYDDTKKKEVNADTFAPAMSAIMKHVWGHVKFKLPQYRAALNKKNNHKFCSFCFEVEEGEKLMMYPLKELDHMKEVFNDDRYEDFVKKNMNVTLDYEVSRAIATGIYNDKRTADQKKKLQISEREVRPFWVECCAHVSATCGIQAAKYDVMFHIIDFHKKKGHGIDLRDIAKKYNLWAAEFKDGYHEKLAQAAADLVI